MFHPVKPDIGRDGKQWKLLWVNALRMQIIITRQMTVKQLTVAMKWKSLFKQTLKQFQ